MAEISCILLILLLGVPYTTGRCPAECSCREIDNRKIVTCSAGGMTSIPTTKMDADVQTLIVTAPHEKPNNLSIGRIFLHMYQLEDLSITYSSIPAIGDSSFWPGRAMRSLDLSNNKINFLHDSNFNGLKHLVRLDLSDNQIAATPSAPFLHLASLKSLSLARNRLQSLVPRFFYMLPHLEELDLSGNPLGEVDPENLQDVRGLRILRLSKCNLTHLHSVLYQQLPKLLELDLRDNSIYVLAPEEFRHLRSLKVLRLDGNKLTNLEESTFQGHNFDYLGLSRNAILNISPCAFCNSSIKSLDISRNRLSGFNSALHPVANSLRNLVCSYNRLDGSAISNAVRPLKELQELDVSKNVVSFLSDDTFINNRHLKHLNLSFNQIDDLSQFVLQPLLSSLQEVDLSFNQFPSFRVSTLEQLDAIAKVHILENLLSCTSCNMMPMLGWANASSLYNFTCERYGCLYCKYPSYLAGREIHTLAADELGSCTQPITQSRVLVMTSQLGIIVGASVAVVLFVLVILLISVYRRHGAVYYTHEDERTYNGMYENLMAGAVNGYEEKPVFYTTLDRIEEIGEEKSPFKHG